MNSLNIPSKRIFINGRFLTQQTSGVQAFARGLCRELLQVVPGLHILIPEKAVLLDPEFTAQLIRTGSLQGHLWEQLHLPRFMKAHPGAMLINLCNSAPLGIHNQAVTIHDLAFIKNPAWFHPAFSKWYRFLIPRIIAKSKLVITVSETIKKELIATGFADERKIVVTGNKVAQSLLDAAEVPPSDKRLPANGFFLMTGSADPRKNFKFVEQFFTTQLPERLLVIAGGSHKNFRAEVPQQNDRIIRLGYVSENELKWLYRHATAFINPSLYEGFGIPNLEAMAFGCPVICSDIPVFREICGDAVHYFELNSTVSLKRSIDEVLENKMLTETKTLGGKGIFTEIQTQNRTSKILKALFQ